MTAREIDYSATGYFSKIVTDYLDNSPKLSRFYSHKVSAAGIAAAIEARKRSPVNRELLVEQLTTQYSTIDQGDKIRKQLHALLDENTFTICTAHQPNIFTGHLYFIYKILHVIQLADHLNKSSPGNYFVPVFYMGNEDADLAELGHIYLDGQKYTWDTKQTGAVGRMVVDDAFLDLVTLVNGRLSIEPHGKELVEIIGKAYTKGRSIADATLHLVHWLFGQYGLVVISPDNDAFKAVMISIFEDDILNNTAEVVVNKTNEELGEMYEVQASPRQINLFYLDGDKRERIIEDDGKFRLNDGSLFFTKDELLDEIKRSPG
ncbi:MAG: bacillithiol biosynthesis BshC, partial [Chitinophagaceae bacterium]